MLSVTCLQRFLNFDFLVSLDDVALADVVISRDADTAVITRGHFLDIILQALERAEVAGVLDDTVADQAHLGTALDAALAHDGSGNCADLGDVDV
mgnify:CR=1 FL=1